nr:PREDICTED: syntaxin-16 isoform X2 [Bos indicus]
MATRRLTDAFLLLRNNSIQNRQLLAEQVSSHTTSSPLHSRSIAALADDRMALVSGISLDPEAAIGVTKRSPPKWVDGVDEIQYDVGRIKQKMKELASLHDQHLNRPTLDDSSEQEHAIEITTQEITQLFHRCQRAVQALPSRARRACSEQEERLLRNVVASLAQALQELSTSFRHAQSSYLRRMKNREERSQHFFATSVPLMDDGEDNTLYDRGFTDEQLVLVEQNTLLVEEREREIRQIVQSISDLNEIFRDLGAMIVEQAKLSWRRTCDFTWCIGASRVCSDPWRRVEILRHDSKFPDLILIRPGLTGLLCFLEPVSLSHRWAQKQALHHSEPVSTEPCIS